MQIKNFEIYIISSILIIIGMVTAVLSGFFLYKTIVDNEILIAQARASDIITFFIIIPIFIIALILSKRGSLKGIILWFGCLIYSFYGYLYYVFQANYNPLFLLFVGIVALSFFTLIGLYSQLIQEEDIKCNFDSIPSKMIGIFLITTSCLVILMWLREIITGLITNVDPPQVVDYNKHAIYGIDLIFFAPTSIILGILVVRRNSKFTFIAGAFLVKMCTYGAAVALMNLFMINLEYYVNFIVFPIMTILVAISFICTILFFKNTKIE